jgi:hypothetical protein
MGIFPEEGTVLEVGLERSIGVCQLLRSEQRKKAENVPGCRNSM